MVTDRGVHAQRVCRGESAQARDCSGGHRVRGAAHGKHDNHVPDTGGVPAEGLVEGLRPLPRVASRGNGAGHAWGAAGAGCRQGGRLVCGGAMGQRPGRTTNM